jgi:hypothetical protein
MLGFLFVIGFEKIKIYDILIIRRVYYGCKD